MVARLHAEQAGFPDNELFGNHWKRVRAAEGDGLENRCAATPHRGFESHRFRSTVKPPDPLEHADQGAFSFARKWAVDSFWTFPIREPWP